jgi:hypothetical protein
MKVNGQAVRRNASARFFGNGVGGTLFENKTDFVRIAKARP